MEIFTKSSLWKGIGKGDVNKKNNQNFTYRDFKGVEIKTNTRKLLKSEDFSLSIVPIFIKGNKKYV